MIKGTCLCGTVTWAANDTPTPLSHCHCSMCRKAHGAPFVTFTSCRADAFRWTSGAHAICTYESSAALPRRFCGTCGSALPCDDAQNGRVDLPAGGITTPLDATDARHIFTGSKAAFVAIPPDATQFETSPEDIVPIQTAPPRQATDGTLTGSCLCNAVAWTVTLPFRAIFNCHCSRCRKARAAAHATNGFAPCDALHFLRGENQITAYKLPEAKAFGHAFCQTCGGGVPRFNELAEAFNVPVASMDGTGDIVPDRHIFVHSKADWHDISDSLPQNPEGF